MIWVGWSAGFVLIAGVIVQLVKQWRSKSSEGLSPMLPASQIVANAGYAAYAYSRSDAVFLFSSVALTMLAIATLALTIYQKKNSANEQ